MFESIKKVKILIFGLILAVVGIGLSFLSYGISCWCNYEKFPYYIVLLSFSFLYGLLAYVSGDILIIKYRRKVQEINPVIPEAEQKKIWDARTPFIIGLILVLLVTGVLYIVSLFIGRWPLL